MEYLCSILTITIKKITFFIRNLTLINKINYSQINL